MKKFVMVYRGNTSAPIGTMEETMKQWMDWFGELGSAIVDGGNPFDDEGAMSVTVNGASKIEKGNALSGYTIVNAENIEAACEMAKGCPIHKQEGGVASVEVYEALPM